MFVQSIWQFQCDDVFVHFENSIFLASRRPASAVTKKLHRKTPTREAIRWDLIAVVTVAEAVAKLPGTFTFFAFGGVILILGFVYQIAKNPAHHVAD